MKNINILSATLILLFLFPAISSRAEITRNISFDKTKLILGQKCGTDSQTYTTVDYDLNPAILTEGSPKLPYKVFHFLVPDGMSNFTVGVIINGSEVITLDNKVFPVQAPQKTDIGVTRPPFVSPDQAVYSSAEAFPSQIATIAGDGYFDGDKHILSVAVSPVQYEPLYNRLVFFNNVTVTIHYSSTRSASAGSLQPLVRNCPEDPGKLELLQNMIENKESVSDILMQASASRESAAMISPKRVEVSTLPVYEYCIITSRELIPAFERLCGWKRMKGFDAGIVAIEDICADPNITGDLASNYFDNAGKLRQYLTAAWSNGTKYALLGGDYTVVPVRYKGGSEQDMNPPSDLYFSELNSIWTKNGIPNPGTYPGQMDYYPEIYVGRLLCTNASEIATYTEKLLRYEINPGDGRTNPGNMDYLKKAFYMQSDQMQDEKQAQEKLVILDSIFTTQTLFEEEPSFDAESPTFPTGNDVINEMNKGYGFFSWAGHGNPSAVATMTKGINGASHCILSWQGQYPHESANGLDNMNNSKYPGIVYSISCTNMPFDDFETNGYNLGESFTVKGDYGGVAFLGNTRIGLIDNSNELYNCFAKIIAGGERRLCTAYAMSKVDIQYGGFVNFTHNFIGCPEMEMWTDVPAILKDFAVKTTSSYVTITNNSQFDNWTCHISGLFQNDDLFRHYNTTGMKRFGAGVSIRTYTTMFTRPNSLPYIPVLKIENVNITGKSYIFGTDVKIGNKVGDSSISGDVTLKSGASATFEISGEMLLEKGFEIEPGASFELKPFDLMK